MVNSSNDVQWDDIDKFRFYGLGTGMYTMITMALHPMNVIKTRQQVLTDSNQITSHMSKFQQIRGMYRGLGIVLVVAVPARSIYMGTMEHTKNYLQKALQSSNVTSDQRTLMASITGCVAGGVASGVTQTVVVPMDVISQRQMLNESGSAVKIISDILRNDGLRGFYRGFGMSLFSSLPIGALWWGSYSGMQNFVQGKFQQKGFDTQDLSVRSIAQIVSGVTAAAVAATLTQPLDVIKTHVQVSSSSSSTSSSMMQSQLQQKVTYSSVARELYSKTGTKGFFRGTTPRVTRMAMWGTVLSGAHQVLCHVSRKDYEFDFDFDIGQKLVA